jgi:hypothetical protein
VNLADGNSLIIIVSENTRCMGMEISLKKIMSNSGCNNTKIPVAERSV